MTTTELSLFKELIKEIVKSTVKEVLKDEMHSLMKKDLKEIKLLLATHINESRNNTISQPGSFINKAENKISQSRQNINVNSIRDKIQENKTFVYQTSNAQPIGTVNPEGTLPEGDFPFVIDMESDIFKDIMNRE